MPRSQDLPGGHDVVDVDVLDEGFHLRALLDLLLRHRLRHLFYFNFHFFRRVDGSGRVGRERGTGQGGEGRGQAIQQPTRMQNRHACF